MYVILNPILNIKNSFAFSDFENTINQITNESFVAQQDIARTYILGLENNLKSKIADAGFEVEYIQFYILHDYSAVAKIEVKMKYGTFYDKDKIKNIVLESFNIGIDNISII